MERKSLILLAVLMVMLLCFSLFACGAEEPAATTQAAEAAGEFKVGFGRADITSKSSVPLAGYGNTTERMSQGALTFLYATCIAITDGAGESVLFYTIDHVCTNADWMEDFRTAITEATGVPGDRILMSATHTHSGPDVRDQVTSSHPYYAIYKEGLISAAKQAMADQTPATVASGSTTVDGLNFVRHYMMSDGNMAGDNYGDFTVAKAVDNHHKADNEVQIIQFAREGKKDVVMINFQVHPKLTSTASSMDLDTPWTIPVIYLGFGAGLAIFMFTGFVKSIPLEIEEAAAIDGCSPFRTFFSVVLPMMKPTLISVTILEMMWVWNDYLLPYLVLDITEYRTLPIHIQYLKGSYGTVDLGATMALILLSIIPVIVFYLTCQKHIIKHYLHY